jgi:hypothetical protein
MIKQWVLTTHRQTGRRGNGLHSVGGVTLIHRPVAGLHVADGQRSISGVVKARVKANLSHVLGPTVGGSGVTAGLAHDLDCLTLYCHRVLWFTGEPRRHCNVRNISQ